MHADRFEPSPWLEGLNQAQRLAAGFGRKNPLRDRFEAGPLLVIAGAGTGKTSTIAHRVAHLVANQVDPSRILLLTFSRRAALEMTRRAQQLLTEQSAGRRRGSSPGFRLPWAGTFHSIAARLLRLHAKRLDLPSEFGILDRSDAADLIDLIRHEHGLSATAHRFPRKDTCLAIYSRCVNSGAALDQVLESAYPWCRQWQPQLRTLYRDYVHRKQANALLDYDDLLLWLDAALGDRNFAQKISARFDHVLVDEYQDTNALQVRILFALKPDGDGLMVVGDDAQSIYAFRAADVGNILEFPQRFSPPSERITLEQNYRSVQPVLDLANALIGEGARRYPKNLRADRGNGSRPMLVTVLDERAQADWVIAQVLAQRETGVALRHQAVLFRSAHHSDFLEVELTRRNIPFVKHGGLRFLESAHVKDLLAVLRWAHNPRDTLAAFRALQLHAGMGPAQAHRCLAHLARVSPASLAGLVSYTVPAAAAGQWPRFVALIDDIADPAARWQGQFDKVCSWYRPILEQRYDDALVRAADLDMLGAIAQRFGSREQFLTELALDPPQASGDLAGEPLRDEDYLILSTVHTAKGQEWKSVYLLNVADGNFPNEYATGDPLAIEEERRLLYVAITRARDSLQLIEPLRYYLTEQARHGGMHVHGARSRFLSPAVLACLDQVSGELPETLPAPLAREESDGSVSESGIGGADEDSGDDLLPRIDIAQRIRSMW